jgi:hypothetical protein
VTARALGLLLSTLQQVSAGHCQSFTTGSTAIRMSVAPNGISVTVCEELVDTSAASIEGTGPTQSWHPDSIDVLPHNQHCVRSSRKVSNQRNRHRRGLNLKYTHTLHAKQRRRVAGTYQFTVGQLLFGMDTALATIRSPTDARLNGADELLGAEVRSRVSPPDAPCELSSRRP